MMDSSIPTPKLTYGAVLPVADRRVLATEVAVALSYNGSTQAVMMATPDDLIDFAYGFSLTEGLATADQIESVEVIETCAGIDVQIWVADAAQSRLAARRRMMAGPVGCGLCGIDSLEQAMRAAVPVTAALSLTALDVMAAVTDLTAHQPLHDTTRAAHGAAFWQPGRGIVAAREDVGRHNALDKLAGAMVRAGTTPIHGAIVLTSRVSIDMVQKVAMLGAPVIIAVSAPTADAVTLAEHSGITLIALARPDRFEVFTHTDRLTTEESHVG
jgi:FdhD protein